MLKLMIPLHHKIALSSIVWCTWCLVSCAAGNTNANNKNVEPSTQQKMSNNDSLTSDTATFGAGCFWCVEAIFLQLDGVYTVQSGYSGGSAANPTYKQVCGGNTGHAEVIQVVFNPKVISFDDLLEVFWQTHDPTTLNRQGADYGTQYRSVVFYHSDFQKERAEYFKKKLNDEGAYSSPVVTEITAFSKFYKAEDYHQDYYNQNSSDFYCTMVIQPKVEKFKKAFSDKLKASGEK